MSTPYGQPVPPTTFPTPPTGAYHFDPRTVPAPPRLHWGWVLALTMITRSYFNSIWMVVQANWVKRVTGRYDALYWTIAHLAALPIVIVLAIGVGVTMAFVPGGHATTGDSNTFAVIVGGFAVLVILGTYIKAAYTLRSALEASPISIPLGGVMTFFFSAVYFQYFLHDYVMPDPAEVYGPLGAAPAYVPSTSPEPSV